MKSTDIVGYTFNADVFCPLCLVDAMEEEDGISNQIINPDYSVEDYLRDVAQHQGIDLSEPFDSSEFPKVIFADQVTDDRCGLCNEELNS